MKTLTIQELSSYFNARANYKSAEELWSYAKKDLFALVQYFESIYYRSPYSFNLKTDIEDIEDLHNGTIKVTFEYDSDRNCYEEYIPIYFLTGDWDSVDEAVKAFKDYRKKKREEETKKMRRRQREQEKEQDAKYEEHEKKEYIRLKKKFEVVNDTVVGRNK